MFPIGERPDFIEDLNQIEDVPSEIAIQGKTKNLERLKELSGIEKLWLYTVNQTEFDLIVRYVRPKIFYICVGTQNQVSYGIYLKTLI
jgi:hypothetical protein